MLKAQKFTKAHGQSDVIKLIKFNNEFYYLNETKGLLIKETRAPLIVKEHYIPIYKGNVVHFRDVFPQIIKNAFDSTGEDYLPHPTLV